MTVPDTTPLSTNADAKFATAGTSGNKTRDLLIAGAIALIGAIVGSYVTANIQFSNDVKKRQVQQIYDSFRMEAPNASQAYADIRIFVTGMADASVMSAPNMKKLAALMRQHPNCLKTNNFMRTDCKTFLMSTIAITREEAGSGEVSIDDLTIVLNGKWEQARLAAQAMTGKEIP